MTPYRSFWRRDYIPGATRPTLINSHREMNCLCRSDRIRLTCAQKNDKTEFYYGGCGRILRVFRRSFVLHKYQTNQIKSHIFVTQKKTECNIAIERMCRQDTKTVYKTALTGARKIQIRQQIKNSTIM